MQRTPRPLWLKPGLLALPPSTSFSLHAYLSSQPLSMLLEMNIDKAESVFSIPPRGQLCASGSLSFLYGAGDGRAHFTHTSCSAWHLLLPLMHLYVTLKGCGLMTADHSICLGCSCKYSNEPSSVDGMSDNGSIFYLPLLVCDSRIYSVDCIIVPKSA